jgi:hypothetical protein
MNGPDEARLAQLVAGHLARDNTTLDAHSLTHEDLTGACNAIKHARHKTPKGRSPE